MDKEEKVEQVEEEVKPPKKSESKKLKVMRLNSGRGGKVRLRSIETKEVKVFGISEVDMNLKTFNVTEEFWKKGE